MMKFVFLLTIVVNGFIRSARAQQQVPDLSTLPACALSCLSSSISSSSCNTTDFACICADTPLLDDVGQCVLRSCSVRQALTTQSIINTICKVPVRDIGSTINAIAAGFGAASLVAVLARFGTRLSFAASGLGWDDIAIFVPILALFPITACQFMMTRHGLGRDIWAIQQDSIDIILMWYYVAEVLYVLITAMTKISLTLLYLRIFPSRSTTVSAWTLLAVSGVFFVTFTFAVLFQCSPVPYAWQFWDGERKGTCMDTNTLVWSMAAINITLDILVLAVPIPELTRLSMTLRKKIYLLLIFGLGFFVTIVSMIRLRSLVKFSKTRNFTYDNATTAYWSLVEINVGIICVSLPTIRPLLRRIMPQCFGFGSLSTPASAPSRSDGIQVRSEIERAVQLQDSDESDVMHLVDLKQPWAKSRVFAKCEPGGD